MEIGVERNENSLKTCRKYLCLQEPPRQNKVPDPVVKDLISTKL